MTKRNRSEPFFAVFRFKGFDRGHAVFEGPKNRTVIMFLKDLGDMIGQGYFLRPSNDGYWTRVKRGRNYGVRYLGVGPPQSKGGLPCPGESS